MFALARSLVAVRVAVLIAASGYPAAAQNGTVTFLHISDAHEFGPTNGKGGFAPLMTLLRKERQRSPEAITTLGGNFLSPSLMSGMDGGAHMVTLLNTIGIDAAVFGNHEFDFGPDAVAKRIGESKFAWLGTNVQGRDGNAFAGSVETWTRKVGDIKVGVFGLLMPETRDMSRPGEAVEFRDITSAADGAVKALKAAGAHVVVALTHLPFGEDRRLAGEVKGINLILGGHDHSSITWYENDTLILKSGSDARFLGAVDLTVATKPSENGPVTTVVPARWSLVSTAGVTPDPEASVLVKTFADRLATALAAVIGKTTTDLDSRRDAVRSAETTMGNLIADALRAHMKADVGLINGGSIRSDALRPAGSSLTRKDILADLPFGNVGVLAELKGTDLRAALENGVSSVADGAGRFPQVSGLSFAYNPKAPSGARIVDVKVGGEPLDPAATYRVATLDDLLKGGDGYAAFGRGKPLVDDSAAVLVATIVMNYIEAAGTVAPAIEGRIVVRP